MKGHYVYRVTQPDLPNGATSPIINDVDIENWLNKMAEFGWEFVGCGIKFWKDRNPQSHWIFRRFEISKGRLGR